MSDSESEEDNDDEDDLEEKPLDAEETAPPVSKLIESDEEEEEIPATPVPETKTRTGRRRVRRLVDKTYMDEKGYMVTKKEYESASESDTEEPPVKKTVTPKKQEKVEAPAAKKPKLTGSGGKGQAGIMNFFKKK